MQSSIKYKGVEVSYLDFGKGETTLFLHGWEGSIDSFLFVANQIEGRKILIDLPPFGNSKPLEFAWDLFDYVGLVKYVMTYLGVQKYNIVAHSFGGRIALVLGTSKNVNKMVLTGCAGIKDKSIKLKFKILKYKFVKALSNLKLVNKDRLKGYGSSDYTKLNPIMKQTFKNIVNLDLTDILKYIHCEIFLIWGEKDTATHLSDGKLMKKKIKNCGLFIIENGSHFAYIEYPNIFISAVKLFLKA